MNKKYFTLLVIALVSSPVPRSSAQAVLSPASQVSGMGYAEQTARILELTPRMKQLTQLQRARGCNAPVTPAELVVRQELSESIQAAALDVDSVVAEISNEQGELSNLRTVLQMKRDKTVARYNTAALITGSGASAAVSATQFTNLGSQTNNIGDGVGIGAGVASTVFSVIAARKQNGPKGTVGEVPNMLAPLFEREPTLNTFYPPSVLHYLEVVPANQDPSRGTRLEQLKAKWMQTGRLTTSHSNRQPDLTPLTSSENPEVKVSIQDLSNRIAMLIDVAGNVSLMKRDLATLVRSMGEASGCPAVPSQDPG